jgi:hypothetical protein
MELPPELLYATGWLIIGVYVVWLLKQIFWGPDT